MLLTSIELRNFRGFRGFHKFRLDPASPQQPVILMGGENGAGKTSILEAAQIALFGRRAAGSRITADDYERYLGERITRPRAGHQPLRKAGVALEFEHSSDGQRHRYRVDRGWERRGSRIVEDLLVLRDGEPLPGLGREHWQAFVHDLMPPALAGLFFFDGERIQALADDSTGVEFANAVRSLLGIDTVLQLQADLDTYLERSANREGGDSDRLGVEAAESKLLQLRAELDLLHEEHARTQSLLDRSRAQQQAARDRFIQEGGEFARERAGQEARESQLVRDRASVENELQELVAGLLPFAVAPRLARGVLNALEDEAAREQQDAKRAGWIAAESHLDASLHSDEFWQQPDLDQLSSAAKHLLIQQLAGILRTGVPVADAPSQTIHQVTPAIRDILRIQLGKAVGEVTNRARQLSSDREHIEQELAEVRTNIRRAPHETALQPLEQSLNQWMKETLRLEGDLQLLADRRDTTLRLIDDEHRKRDRIAERIGADQTVEERQNLAARARLALRAFEERLSKRRIAQLEMAIAGSFNRLAHKQELVSAVRLDLSTFQAQLFDPQGAEIPRQLLSAGEKQIFAISLLWALAQVSGRRLPMIIDTPLGRLDGSHRSQLIHNYFPYAAQQVVVLSTDTEVDRTWAEQLMPAVSRAYRIDHDRESDSAVVRPGYFWNDDPGSLLDTPLTRWEQESDDTDDDTSADPFAAVEPTPAFG